MYISEEKLKKYWICEINSIMRNYKPGKLSLLEFIKVIFKDVIYWDKEEIYSHDTLVEYNIYLSLPDHDYFKSEINYPMLEEEEDTWEEEEEEEGCYFDIFTTDEYIFLCVINEGIVDNYMCLFNPYKIIPIA